MLIDTYMTIQNDQTNIHAPNRQGETKRPFFCCCFFNNSIEFSNEIRDLMIMIRCFRSGVAGDVRGKSAKRKKKEVLRTELCSKSILPCIVNAILTTANA